MSGARDQARTSDRAARAPSAGIRALGGRLHRHRDAAACAVIATIVACAALQRMGFLSPANQQDILAVDSARTAHVARNIADGKGYTTDMLPAALVAFYDRAGRLHDDRWVNADRFPLAAYAIAALYTATGRRDAWTGIIGYNLITFVAFLTALYVFTTRVTGSQAGGAIAVALALLHGHTYVFLWMKDADMLLLSVLALSCFQRYFATPLGERSSRQMLWFGTVLAWSFLSRPNVGAPLMLALALISLVEVGRGMRRLGAADALRRWLGTDVMAGVAAAVWIVPFLLHSLQTWGSPFFSANALYQPILGTRFGMATDTWWRYLHQDFDYSVTHLWQVASGEVIAKFTTSWRRTVGTFVTSYYVEIALALSALPVGRRRAGRGAGPESGPAAPGLRGAAIVMLACFAFNFLTLPLYSYRYYSWRHYLAFVLPLLWVGAASGALRLGAWLSPTRETPHVRHVLQTLLVLFAAGLILSSAWAPGIDGNVLAMGVTNFWHAGIRMALLALASLVAIALWRRWSSTPWLLALSTIALVVLYRPNLDHRNFTHTHLPASDQVWTELRQRRGPVAALALQALVPWNTGRKTVMAPEFVMNLYEMNRAHGLAFEDIYIESPEVELESSGRLFGAPGFEGYQRLARYRDHLPGYRLAFHEEGAIGDPRYGVPPRPKSSTIYTLADPAAAAELLRTPTSIAIGEEAAVVHTAHGFGGYYRISDMPTVAATDATRRRYALDADRPWEDTSVTFFVDTAVPARVTIRFYAVGPNVLTFYWNLDLDQFTPAAERATHQIGEIAVSGRGWQDVTLDVPPALVRRGLNKLGFRAETFTVAALCDIDTLAILCPTGDGAARASVMVRTDTGEPDGVVNVSVLLERVDFDLRP